MTEARPICPFIGTPCLRVGCMMWRSKQWNQNPRSRRDNCVFLMGTSLPMGKRLESDA